MGGERGEERESRGEAWRELVEDYANQQKQDKEVQQSAGVGKRVFPGLVGLVFFVAGVVMFLQFSLPPVMLRTTGVSTGGVVERLVESRWVSTGQGGGESKYHVYYSFVLPEGEVIQGHTQLASSDWFSLRVRQRVTVLYLPNNPRHNCLADYRLWGTSILIMIVFPPLFSGIGILLLKYAVTGKFGVSKVPK